MTVGVFSLDNEMRKCVRDEWLNKRGRKGFLGGKFFPREAGHTPLQSPGRLNSLPYGPAYGHRFETHLVPVNPNWISMLPCTPQKSAGEPVCPLAQSQALDVSDLYPYIQVSSFSLSLSSLAFANTPPINPARHCNF